MFGYPDAGLFVAAPARIREITRIKGPDIYRKTNVSRQVYLLNGTAEVQMKGLSGGPLIDLNGRVIGVVYGQGTDDRDIGFAVTAAQVAPQLAALGNTETAATGACAH